MTRRYTQAFTDWHWGIAPKEEIDWTDPRKDENGDDVYPENLIECGRFTSVEFIDPHTRSTGAITLTRAQANRSHWTFNSDHRYGRLYILIPPDIQAEVKKRYWTKNQYAAQPLAVIARKVGGLHSTSDYPALKAKPIGLITLFVYTTEKEGDGTSHYKHRAGEVSGIRPCLAADEHGRLWVVGGNYTSPIPGVTD